jgi:glutaredoxin-like protein NrdH
VSQPAVAVYVKNNCQPCKRTKKELELRGVTYTEINLETDPAALEYVTGLGHQQAPVVVVDTATQPVHWSGLVPALINLHFGPRQAAA